MRVIDRQFVLSLGAFAAVSAVGLACLWLFVLWGGWMAAAALAGAAVFLLYRFYRGARPDRPPPDWKEAP